MNRYVHSAVISCTILAGALLLATSLSAQAPAGANGQGGIAPAGGAPGQRTQRQGMRGQRPAGQPGQGGQRPAGQPGMGMGQGGQRPAGQGQGQGGQRPRRQGQGGQGMGGFGGGQGFGGGMGGFGGGMGGQQGPRSSVNTVSDIQTKFPDEYKEAQKLRQTDPAAYRAKLRELQGKLTESN